MFGCGFTFCALFAFQIILFQKVSKTPLLARGGGTHCKIKMCLRGTNFHVYVLENKQTAWYIKVKMELSEVIFQTFAMLPTPTNSHQFNTKALFASVHSNKMCVLVLCMAHRLKCIETNLP